MGRDQGGMGGGIVLRRCWYARGNNGKERGSMTRMNGVESRTSMALEGTGCREKSCRELRRSFDGGGLMKKRRSSG
jgi:hypothetical protein